MMHPSIYRLRLADILTVCVLGLLLLGVLMVHSASMNVTGEMTWHWGERAVRHVMFAAVGLVAYLLVARVDYRRLAGSLVPQQPADVEHELEQNSALAQNDGVSVLEYGVNPHKMGILRSPAVWLFVASCALCVLVLIPGIGVEVNGARRWLSIGFTRIQPSELGKWSVILLLAVWLWLRPVDVRSLGGLLLTLVPVGIVGLLVVIEDFGTAVLIGLACLALCVAGRVRVRHLLMIFPPMVAVGTWFLMAKEYRWRRMTAFMDPFASPEREGYHMVQSLMSFATGGISGTGLGSGIQKLGYLPEDTTDFIFAVICEELGLFGAMLTIGLYVCILLVSMHAVRRRGDELGRLLAFGIGALVALQALINIAVATVSVPPKGLSLPLVSAGGTGLIITCAALGVLASVCREDEKVADEGHTDQGREGRSVSPTVPSEEPDAADLQPALQRLRAG